MRLYLFTICLDFNLEVRFDLTYLESITSKVRMVRMRARPLGEHFRVGSFLNPSILLLRPVVRLFWSRVLRILLLLLLPSVWPSVSTGE